MQKLSHTKKTKTNTLVHLLWYGVSLCIVFGAVYSVIKDNMSSHALQVYTPQPSTSDILSAKVITPGPLTQDPAVEDSQIKNGSVTLAGILAKTNLERTNISLIALTHSRKLDASAQKKAADILQRQYFEHTAPDGKTVTDLVTEQGYNYIKVGENLALGTFASDDEVVQAWMHSPGHRANILDTDYTEMGVGVAYGTYEGKHVVVVVQHFGRPISLCPILDASMKIQVGAMKAELDGLAQNLDTQKNAINQGIDSKQDVTVQINTYNQAVDAYSKKAADFEKIRVAYNKEVDDFNKCVSALH